MRQRVKTVKYTAPVMGALVKALVKIPGVTKCPTCRAYRYPHAPCDGRDPVLRVSDVDVARRMANWCREGGYRIAKIEWTETLEAAYITDDEEEEELDAESMDQEGAS